MAMGGFWTPDWLFGLSFALFLLMTISSTFVQSAQRWVYDVGVGASDLSPSQRVAVIGIDERRIAYACHSWWLRDAHSAAVDPGAGAEAVGYMPFWFACERNSRRRHRNSLIDEFRSPSGGGRRSRTCQRDCAALPDRPENLPSFARYSRCDCEHR